MFLRVVFVTLALALAYAVLDWATRPTRSAAQPAVEPVSNSATPLVMYSLTTCAPCKVRAAELHAAGVPFTEYKIDIDADARARLEAKLRVQTPAKAVVGTPIFEIADQLIFGNPTVPELQQRLGGAGGKPFSFFRS